MTLQRWLTIVVVGVLGMVNATMAQDTPWHYDFEDMLSAQADAGNQISLSTRHYKWGQQSLAWSWENGGRLLFTDPAPGRDEGLTSFRAWVYSEQAMPNAKLTFQFGTESELAANNPRYKFKFGLNFTGWRVMWVNLTRNATNAGYTGPRNGRVTAFEIKAPGTGSLYLDLMEMVNESFQGVGGAIPDEQVPFIRGGEDVVHRFSLNTLPGPIPAEITAEERRAFETIARRYDAWVLGDNVNSDQRQPVRIRLEALANLIQRGHNELENYQIRREGSVILGKPLFNRGSPYKPNFENIFFGFLLPLVLDYRLNNNLEARNRVLDTFDYMNDQGWAAGSGLGAVWHIYNRMAGYAHSVFLMREDLRATGRLKREEATMHWYTAFGEVYEQTWNPGTNADYMRSYSIFRLMRVLMMDDTPEKVAAMRRYVAWLNNALAIAPGRLDTIKPDYVGFHHGAIYANAYAPHGFHVASLVVYLLHDTPFAVDDDKRDNLKNALLTSRIMTNTYDISTAINGRFPFNTRMAGTLVPACMYTALSYTPVDEELAIAFMQLWKPESPDLYNGLFSRAGVRIMYLDSPGSAQMMANFAEAGYTAPEVAPSGHWTMPYGALSIHRREDWMVSMKGWSKYVWDFEQGGRNENPIGRYLSYGSTLIYSTGDPPGRAASGIVRRGWDWSMWPGTTAIRLSHEELWVPNDHRHFQSETFVGGVNIEGQNGIFALKLHDTHYDDSFRAVKTVFCFDDVLVCLGSGIENNDGGHKTVTTLFQTSISEDRPTVVNGTGVLAIPYTFSGTSSQRVWLMDASGNGYVIPDGGGLRVQREVQAPGDIGRDGGVGEFELAYLDHGFMPQDGGYEYAVLVQQPFDLVRGFADAPEYVVRQRDSQAHIVYYPEKKTTGYALFNVATRPTNGAIVSVDLPSLVMTREVDDGLLLSVADPNFGWSWVGQNRNQASRSRPLQVTVRGQWRLDSAHQAALVTTNQSDPTVVMFFCQDGKTVEVKLIRIGVSLASLDFDEDNVIGSTDFLLFVSHFGLSEGDADFDTKYDIDGNGVVGFSDFVIFAEEFGKSVSGKPVAL